MKMTEWKAVVASALAAGLVVSSVKAGETTKQVDDPKRIEARSLDGKAQSIWERDMLTGDWGGGRTWLSDRGLDFSMEYTGETMGVLEGGTRRGFTYEHLLETALDFDLEKMAGWKGGAFHVGSYWIWGTTPNNLNGAQDINSYSGSISDPSNIDAYDTLRMGEMYLQQQFLDGKLTLRGGQLAADSEHFASDYAGLFVSGTFGWPNFMAANTPNAGPGYPSTATGFFVRTDPIEEVYVQALVVNGDPGSQNRTNRYGTRFRLDDGEGLFTMYEAGYKLNQKEGDKGLPGTYKLGGWYLTDDVNHQRLDDGGRSLADDGTLSGVASSGTPLQVSGNSGIYGIIDQMVWREKAEGDEGLGLFTRLAGAPDEDRNVIDFYVDGGAHYKGLIPGRDEDVFGVAAAYNGISSEVQQLDQDRNRRSNNGGGGTGGPVRSSETLLEVTYKFQIAPWWYVQPDFQYIWQPGGSPAIDDAVIFGVRTGLTF